MANLGIPDRRPRPYRNHIFKGSVIVVSTAPENSTEEIANVLTESGIVFPNTRLIESGRQLADGVAVLPTRMKRTFRCILRTKGFLITESTRLESLPNRTPRRSSAGTVRITVTVIRESPSVETSDDGDGNPHR